jgi:uncharacterized repeat protein (TIGR04138 family)
MVSEAQAGFERKRMEGNRMAGDLEQLAARDPRYKLEAYIFTMSAVEYTTRRLGRQGHVSGRELLEGIRDLAREKFGLTARMVFEHWGVKTTDDFGELVFNLVEAGLLGKTDRDSRDDFKGVYDFSEVFEKHFDWGTRGAV